MPDINPEQLNLLLEKLHRERAVDFRGYKPSSLGRRIQRRLDATKCPDIESYIKLLDKRSDEYSKLVDSILINVTEFFRDPEAWDILKSTVIPQIMAEKQPGDQIRFWSAGCATGEEAYTLAMALSEAIGPHIRDYDVRIYATDIDDDALTFARRAEYPDTAVQSLSDELLERYFTRNARWIVNRDLRKMVIFGRHNLVTDAPISHVDMIICRNVLIYMSMDLQNRILSKFHYGLESPGFLFLGKAESLLTASRLFNPINERWRIFGKESVIGTAARAMQEQQSIGKATQISGVEYQLASQFNEAVLRYTPSGVIAVDKNNIVRLLNPGAESIWGIRGPDLLGKSIFEAALPPSLQSVLPRIMQVRSQRNETRIDELDLSIERGRPFQVSVTLAPMYDVMGNELGLVIVSENITSQVRLRNDLEALNEQAQATNEELETTNEELQSTNEELETTNEELQSTNEELETTNEELQSTNEELSTTNDELSVRTSELNTLSLYYSSVLDNLDVPIVVLDSESMVTSWNPAAERFYGVAEPDAVGRSFFELNLPVRVARTRDKLRTLKETHKPYRSRPLAYKTRTGDTSQITLEYQPLIDAFGSYVGVILTARSVGENLVEPAASGG